MTRLSQTRPLLLTVYLFKMRVMIDFFIAAFCLTSIVSSQTIYTCPSPSEDPVVIPEHTIFSSRSKHLTHQINKSELDTVCVLLRITAKTDKGNINSITQNSNNEDYNLIPVARSYHNSDWQRVAGPYAQSLQITNCCTLDIHSIDTNEEGKLVLISYSNNSARTTREKISRFLQQSTFGPTLSMIDSWDYDSIDNDDETLLSEIGVWVEHQIRSVQATSHREFFRERVQFSTVYESHQTMYRPSRPCDKNARWREYAFTVDDYGDSIKVSKWNGKFLIKVIKEESGKAVPRTIMDEWKDIYSGKDIGTGNFEFCWYEERVGGLVGIYGPSTDDDCYYVYNPQIDLPDEVQTGDITKVTLPKKSTSFHSIDPIMKQFERILMGEAIYLKSDIGSSIGNGCSDIAHDGYYENILGTFSNNGKQAMYAGYIQLDENTVENPIEDAGTAYMKLYQEYEEYKICPVASKNFMNIDSCYLSTKSKACSSSFRKQKNGDAVVVCGSPGERMNNPSKKNIYAFYEGSSNVYETGIQKKNVWTTIALTSDDQLRQRMAWALSQILVVTPNQIEETEYSEVFLNYYDIFVRNAFGNYFDVLKEVSYSPMMAEMLSYLDSKSSAYAVENFGTNASPDENFAREIMQLFSIGIYKLNMDGTLQLEDNSPVLTYKNTDIQNFARAWTGFIRQEIRSNLEVTEWDWANRMDPMRMKGVYRDPFPKADLHGGFIGDKIPLCTDLPEKHFLKKGATYRLLGSSLTTEMHEHGEWWEEDSMPSRVLLLPPSSELKTALLTKQIVVTLDSTVPCTGDECAVDTLRVVKIQSSPPIYYEYMRRPCVEMSFYKDAKKISTAWYSDSLRKSMCANINLEAAHDSCCPDKNTLVGEALCYYDLEKSTYSTCKSRCEEKYSDGRPCDFHWMHDETACKTSTDSWMPDNWFWTRKSCSVKAKVNDDGMVSIVHQPVLMNDHPDYKDTVDLRVHPDNSNFFKVYWKNNIYPNASNSCSNGACQTVSLGCICDIDVIDNQVFNSIKSENEIIEELHIGAMDPQTLGSYNQVLNTGDLEVWHRNGGYDSETIFGINYRGKLTYLKNLKSTVRITGAPQFEYRNPPAFLNIAFREPRDAIYETNAVLKNYFHHENVPPFLAKRLIQRFGISNPSPSFVYAVAKAFKEGFYPNPNTLSEDFGDGTYGNLEAMLAAIILHSEARSIVLDADPTYGSMSEPMIKLTRFLRAMNFQMSDISGESIRMVDLQAKIGQEPHSYPNVFSFFEPEYAAPGHIKAAAITSPEAKVLSGPKIISFLNGIISLVEIGLNECYYGFGESRDLWCEGFEDYYDSNQDSFGNLKYLPSNPDDAASVVQEISLLLTAGRLSSTSQTIIQNAYQNADSTGDGLRLAQKLIVGTPEFHSSTEFSSTSKSRPDIENPEPSINRHKAIVFLMLDGGSDSHNMLIPHSGCSGGKTSYNHYKNVRGNIAVPQNELHQIDATTDQVCAKFGIHPNLPFLKSLYDSDDLLWVANMGVLQEKVTKENWYEKSTETALFAHNTQQNEVHKMDIYDTQAGRGVGGRIADVLIKNRYSASTVSVNGIADALASSLSSFFVMDPWVGLQKFNPIPWTEPLWSKFKKLNQKTKLGSNLFSETWANMLFNAKGENDILYDSLKSTTISTEFPDSELGRQMELVAKLVKSKDSRGSDHDIFYAAMGGYDTHTNIKVYLDELTLGINGALEAFVTEMKAQEKWNDVTIVMVSEFARTLIGNTGQGSDHAWGGNYFIAGGEVDGKKILGYYPDILSPEGPLIIEPGVVIPTLSWDSVWNGIAQWFDISDSADLDEILPNRVKFQGELFNQNDIYKSGITPAPTPGCIDSSLRFKITRKNGTKVKRNCKWVSRNINNRCDLSGVSSLCSNTCDTCSVCEDTILKFRVKINGKNVFKTCKWVLKKKKNRCTTKGVSDACCEAC